MFFPVLLVTWPLILPPHHGIWMLDSHSSFPTSQFIYMIPTFSLFDLSSGSIYLCRSLGAYHHGREMPWTLSIRTGPQPSCYLTCHSQLIPFSQSPVFSPLLSAGLWNLSCLFSAPASLRFHEDGGRLHTVALSLGKVQNQRDHLCSTPLPCALLPQSPP